LTVVADADDEGDRSGEEELLPIGDCEDVDRRRCFFIKGEIHAIADLL
jgi:hypothetical protein